MMEQTFMKYPKIHTLKHSENALVLTEGNEIEITEKVDGANFRFMVKDGKIIFGSRNMSLGDDTQDIGGNWKRCVDFIKDKFKVFGLRNDCIYYGGCMVKHSIDYDWANIPPFLGFGIFDFNKGEFVSNWEEIYKASDIPTINVIFKGKWTGDITLLNVPAKSAYHVGQPEGIVIKNYAAKDQWGNNQWAKIVTDKFKEVNRETFGGGKKFATDDSEKIVAMFCTNSRIDKQIFSNIDSGVKLQMEMMHILPNQVYTDMMEENWREIVYNSTYKVDFKKIRTLVSKRCLSVLKQVITNAALNGG